MPEAGVGRMLVWCVSKRATTCLGSPTARPTRALEDPMQIARASTQPTPTVATPVERAADTFIGEDLLRVDWGRAGTSSPRMDGISGAREGYETLSAAVAFATSQTAKNLQLDPKGVILDGSSYAVVEAADRYAVMSLHEPIAFTRKGRNYAANGYETRRGELGAAVRAVVDAYGQLMRHTGRFGF